jgi:Sensors of blue-light using FAD
MALFRLLYRSDSELTGADRAVREAAFAISDAAAERNQREGITGALMFAGSVFVQMLEGERDALETTFERICRDMRHRRLIILDYSEIEQRIFENWSMVAFEGDERARSLFPAIGEATKFVHRNRMTSTAAVQMMQSMLTRRLSRRKSGANDRMIATDVMG